VGTLKSSSGKRMGKPLIGLDVPTLIGLWEGGPYLHDGSAQTLMDVITTQNPMNRHGNTQQLNSREREQLVAYLMQIDRRDSSYVTLPGEEPVSTNPGANLTVRRHDSRFEFTWPLSLTDAVLEIHDAKGVRMARLNPQSGTTSPRTTVFKWNALQNRDGKSTQGVYFARLTAAGVRHSQRFVLTLQGR